MYSLAIVACFLSRQVREPHHNPSFHGHLSRQAPQPLSILPSPLNIHIDAHIPPHHTGVQLGRYSIAAQLPLRDGHRILLHPVLLTLLGSSKDGVQSLPSTSSFTFGVLGYRHNAIPMVGTSFYDGPGPGRNKIVGLTRNVGRDTFAFCVE